MKWSLQFSRASAPSWAAKHLGSYTDLLNSVYGRNLYSSTKHAVCLSNFFSFLKAPASAEQCSLCLQYVIMSSNMWQEALLLKGKSVFALSVTIYGHLPIHGEVSKGITSSSCQRFQAPSDDSHGICVITLKRAKSVW